MKKITSLDPAMTCPYCGEKQYQTQKSKNKGSVLYILSLLPLGFQLFIDVTPLFFFILLPVIVILIIMITPFLIDISSEEEFTDFYKK